jgi:hypothetical protein
MAHNDENDVFRSDFDEVVEEYTSRPFVLGIEFWDTADLIKLSTAVTAEIQRRYAESTV